MAKNKDVNFLKDPKCFVLHWKPFEDTQFELQDNRIFIFSEKHLVPEITDLIDLKFYLKDKVRDVVFTKWNINSIVFMDPSPAACACLVKFIYTDFGQIKYQTAFYVGDSASKKIWLIR